VSLHAVPTGQCIFDGRSEGVPQVQRPRHVGRRYDHDKLFVGGSAHGSGWIARVVATGLPPILPGGLDGTRMVAIFHGHGREIFLLAFGCGVDKLGFGGSYFGLLFLFPTSTGLVPIWLFLLLAFAFGEFLELAFRELLLGLLWFGKGRAFGKICCHGSELKAASKSRANG